MDGPALTHGTLKHAFVQHMRSVHALALRDFQTRSGAGYIGFLFGLLVPLVHIGVLLVVYHVLGRRAPIGTDVTLYLSSAIVPFIVWSYTHQKMSFAFVQNKPLLAFPIIRMMDIAVARAWVEAVNAVLIVIVVYFTLVLCGFDIFIADPPAFLLVLIMSYLLGIGTGLILGIIAMVAPFMRYVGFLIIPIYWVTSGAFFVPEILPEQIRWIAALFPLTHLVDYGRMALFTSYKSDFPSLMYVTSVISGCFVIGLLMMHTMREILSRK